MKFKRFLRVVALGALVPGCGPIANAARTMLIEPAHFAPRVAAMIECHRDHAVAEEAWERFLAEAPEGDYSPDFAKGFKLGFSDYLFAGGRGLPPPLPPRHYWEPRYQTTDGHRAIADWFDGFRHGAAAAQASGLRELVVIPSSASVVTRPHGPPPSGPPLPPADPLAAPVEAPASAPPPAAAPTLPTPRPLPAPRPVPAPSAPTGAKATTQTPLAVVQRNPDPRSPPAAPPAGPVQTPAGRWQPAFVAVESPAEEEGGANSPREQTDPPPEAPPPPASPAETAVDPQR
jgi:hypothetical protein